MATAYHEWQAARDTIVPGNVFTVVQHVFNVSKQFANLSTSSN